MLSIELIKLIFCAIKLINNLTGVTRHAGSKNYNLIKLSHFFQEYLGSRSKFHIDLALSMFIIDVDYKVRIFNRDKG